ncbi:hypothetical protein ANN_22613 [Periplaneta americana]|uniref:Uncharacterized protein n=1 Tax=Periplaneta americana TaxID=6978 RepID=A0ABQ8S8X8_PERAM|nr:hypothetical protein ANN_22613 [Periplaneta americana]
MGWPTIYKFQRHNIAHARLVKAIVHQAPVKRILRSNWAEQPLVRTPEELWDRVLDSWEEMAKNLDLFHNLVGSIPRRMRAVVDAGVERRGEERRGEERRGEERRGEERERRGEERRGERRGRGEERRGRGEERERRGEERSGEERRGEERRGEERRGEERRGEESRYVENTLLGISTTISL